ncbi:MAG: Gfo/Idh/MocA family oxidoreductase [Verrucomicrobia bacterium]|nr:Gfo/Idh/MocA family oxidoreductase [Verrucomicrobiota bacterium]
MTTPITRRSFLKTTAIGAGAAAGSRLFCAPAIFAAGSPSAKLATAVIGCGGRGATFHIPAAAGERLVAIVDVDEKRLATVARPPKAKHPAGDEKKAAGADFSKVKKFTDYRKMFDKMGKEIDVVFIATPNHHHAPVSLMAMQLGKHVYCEKPLCHDISEARRMAEFAVKYKVATQMGNQGHSCEGMRRLCEYIWAGAIGKVTKVYTWSNRANGGVGPRPAATPVPAGLHWDEWIGPAPYREHHPDTVVKTKSGESKVIDLHPHEWHNWHDFGNGSLGNMGCHVIDGAFWALKLGQATSVETEEMLGGSDERYPVGTRIRWDFPARGDMPPVKLYWFDGKKKGAKMELDANDVPGSVAAGSQNLPPLVEELEKKYKIKLGGNGALYVGDKGVIWSDTYCMSVRIIPESQHKATPVPRKTLLRITGSHTDDFLRACHGGEPACSNFAYAARLTEVVLLGSLAYIAGPGKKIEWDGPGMKCTNSPELERWVKCPVRKGWEV